MVRYERFVNDAENTLSGGITDVATTLTLTDASAFPDEGDYRIAVDLEIMIVTSKSGSTLTVTRAAEGTTAVAHSSGAAVGAIITQGGMDKFITDFFNPYAFDRPQHRLLDDTGAVLTVSDFTEGNFGTSTSVDDAGGSITIIPQTGNGNFRGLYKSAPTAPYTVIAHMMLSPGDNTGNENSMCFGWREDSSSKLAFHEFHIASLNDYDIQYFDDWGTKGSAPTQVAGVQTMMRADYWFKIENDATNLIWSCSSNGYNWFEIHSDLLTDHFDTAPDQIWFGGDAVTAGTNLHLLAWLEE